MGEVRGETLAGYNTTSNSDLGVELKVEVVSRDDVFVDVPRHSRG